MTSSTCFHHSWAQVLIYGRCPVNIMWIKGNNSVISFCTLSQNKESLRVIFYIIFFIHKRIYFATYILKRKTNIFCIDKKCMLLIPYNINYYVEPIHLGSTATWMLLKTLIPPNNKRADCGTEGAVKGEEDVGNERLLVFRIKQNSAITLGLQPANIYSHCRLKYQRKKRGF